MGNNVLFKTSLLKGPQGDRGEAGVADAVPLDGVLAYDGNTIPDGYEETEEPQALVDLENDVDALGDAVEQNTSDIGSLNTTVTSLSGSITALNNGVTQNANNIATQTARIDQIASLPSGSTSGDAELQDIRVGYNGKTYGDAGTAVRTCDQLLQSQVNCLSKENYGKVSLSTSFSQSVVSAQNLTKYIAYNFEAGKTYLVKANFSSYPSTNPSGSTRHFNLFTTTNQDWGIVDRLGETPSPSTNTDYNFLFTASANASYLFLWSVSGAGTVSASLKIFTPSITELSNEITQLSTEVTRNYNRDAWQQDYTILKLNELYNNSADLTGVNNDITFEIGDINLSNGNNVNSNKCIREHSITGSNKRYYIPDGWKLAYIAYYQGSTYDSYVVANDIGHPKIVNASFIRNAVEKMDNCRAVFYKNDETDITTSELNSFIENVKVYWEGKNYPEIYTPSIEKIITFTTGNQIQCATMVNGIMWQSTDASDDHETYNGKIYKFSINVDTPKQYSESSQEVTTCYHNLGHAGIKGYIPYSDLGISEGVFNGNNNLILIKNLSSRENVYVDDPGVIKIELDGQFCIGQTYNTIIGVEDSGNVKKYLLGYGSNDLSNVTGGYGTFIQGCESNEFNGTIKLISTELIEWNTPRQGQHFNPYKGCLGLLTGYRDSELDIYIKKGMYYKKTKILRMYNYANDGSVFYEEPEAFFEYNGEMYLSTWYKYEPTKFFVYKITM